MTQDNIQQDTPQEPANQEQYNSLEEAVFGEGSSDTTSSAFTSGEEGSTEQAPEQGQPQLSTHETQTTPPQPNNDETRYQNWQTQADKNKNELESNKHQQQHNAQQAQQMPAQPAEEPVEEFPAAPERPVQPRSFNREEAYNDPSSESARYMNELEGWRDDMSEYNTLKSQYQTAVLEDRFNQLERTRVEDAQRQQAAQQQAQQQAEVKKHVMGHYGMSESETQDFMTKMSDPSSVNIDNLVQLYRLQNGGAQQQAPAQPSDNFTQTKNAQQVPSPMGVMPSGQNNTENKSFEDKIMDSLIGNFNSKNPWK